MRVTTGVFFHCILKSFIFQIFLRKALLLCMYLITLSNDIIFMNPEASSFLFIVYIDLGAASLSLISLLNNIIFINLLFLKLSKYDNDKSCSPFFIFFTAKKMRRIRSIFDIVKWLRKSEYCCFRPSILKPLKGQKYFYGRFNSSLALLINH